MKLTYVLLLSAIIGFAVAANAAETSKCRSNGTDGKCTTCPSAGSTVGGPRELVSGSCATARTGATKVLTAGKGEAHVEFYGSLTADMTTYTVPSSAAAGDFTKAYLADSASAFTCKDSYATIYYTNLSDSECALLSTKVTFGTGTTVPTKPAANTWTGPGDAALGGFEELPVGPDCTRVAIKYDATPANVLYTCQRCAGTKALFIDVTAAANPQTCTAALATMDSNCNRWYSTAASLAAANTSICKGCVANSALKNTGATYSDSCVTADTVKLANCYKADAAGTACAQCNWDSWMDGSGVCIKAVPSSTTKASGLVSVIISTLLAVMILN